MIENIHWLGHASFRIDADEGVKIYIDPFKLGSGLPQADIILVTHDHFDHCSPEDIDKIASKDTVIIGPSCIADKLPHPVTALSPGEKTAVKGIIIETVPAYNPAKNFHPKANGYLGFIITTGGKRIYHAGDTDFIPEMKSIKADIALLPIGGTYTMTAEEAAQAADLINPAIAVPMHYGSIAGSVQDAEKFKKLCKCKTVILAREE